MSIADYDEAQAAAVGRLCCGAVQAFLPEIRDTTKSVTRVEKTASLVRFLDIRSEWSCEEFFSTVLGGITPAEFDLLQKATGVVCDFSEQWGGTISVPRVPVLEALGLLRQVQFLSEGKQLRIFEVAPGAGYSSLLFASAGHRLVGFEARQAFYVLQQQLWSFFFGQRDASSVLQNNMIEGAFGPVRAQVFEEQAAGDGVHLPWWEVARANPVDAPKCDVVVMNHAAWEMSSAAVKLTLRNAAQMLTDPAPGTRLLICPPWSASNPTSPGLQVDLLEWAGFKLVHQDGAVTIFTLAERCEGYVCSDNEISRRLAHERAKLAEHQYVPYEQLHTLYQLLTGREDPASEEEMFQRLVR